MQATQYKRLYDEDDGHLKYLLLSTVEDRCPRFIKVSELQVLHEQSDASRDGLNSV